MRNVVTCEPAPARLPEEPRSATGKLDELTRAAGSPQRRLREDGGSGGAPVDGDQEDAL